MKLDKTNWVPTRLEDVAYWYQKDIPNSLQEAAGIKYYLTADHIDSDAVTIKRFSELTDGQKGPTISKHFEKGDLLFSTRSTALHKAGIAPVAGVTGEKLLVIRIKPNSEILPELLPFVMQSGHFWDFAINSAAGSVNKFTSWTKIKEYEFLLPPRKQQAQLAELLWAANEVSENYKNLVKALNDITDKFIEQEIISANWELKPISEISDVAYGISDAVAGNKDSTIGCPILTGANINLDGTLSTEALVYYKVPTQERFILRRNDLLLNWRSGSPQHVGKTALFDKDEMMTFASFILRIRANENLNPHFGFYVLNYLRSVEYFTKDIAQQVNFKMNAQVFRTVRIPLPPIDIQNSLVSILNKMRDEKSTAIELNKKSINIRQLIANQIFTS